MSLCRVDTGQIIRVGEGTAAAAATYRHEFILDAEAVAIFLCVSAVAGTVDCEVLHKLDDECPETSLLTFPTVSAVPTQILVRKTALNSSRIIVNVTVAGGPATYEVFARGAAGGEASVRIVGANSFTTDQVDVTTTAAVLIPAALVDRSGLLVENANDLTGGSEILYIAESLAKATTDAKPVRPGGNITIDIAAGQEIYAVASSGTIDCRIVQVGG